MASEATASPVAPTVIETPDGPVTTAPIESLERTLTEKQQLAQQLAAESSQLKSGVVQLEVRAGSILTARRTDWNSAIAASQIAVAQGMEQLIANLEHSLSDLSQKPHPGIGGVVRLLKDRHDAAAIQTQISSARAELENRYRAVVEPLTVGTGIPEADSLLQQVKHDLAAAAEAASKQSETEAEIANLSGEIARRKNAISELGFDAPAVEADLMVNGLRPVSTNLVLKRGEIAAASVPARLCRYRTTTQYVGSTRGFSIPLGHGFRYRVSSFRGHPIAVESLVNVDVGSLVVTNQRLVFLGGKRDVPIPIAKLLQIEAFSNALTIGREGKESRDVYLVANPAYVALYLNWVVAHQS